MAQPTSSKNTDAKNEQAQSVGPDKPVVDRQETKPAPTDPQWQAQTLKNPDDFE
jgi:hypothetical protein